MNRQLAFARLALISSCCLAPLQQALAAPDPTPDPTVIEEVVVSALKTGAKVLDTPATVTVVQAEELAVANVTSAHQLSGIVPGLVTMQGTAGTSAAFRGLGSTSADPSIESSVATFVDGVYLGHPRDYVMPLYDIQQIEFLAGTQSTVLGKNTSLGAISILNRRPGREFGYDATLNYTSKIDAYRLQGGVDVPLGDGLSFRAAMLANHEDGFVRNAFVGRKEREVRELSGRLTLRGDVGKTGEFVLIYQHDDRKTEGQYLEVLTDPNGVIEGTALYLVGQPSFDSIPNDVIYSGSDRLNPADPAIPLPFDDQAGDRATLIAHTDLGKLTLTAQTSYVKWDSTRVTDLDFTSAFLFDLNDRERNKIFSQELRVNSPKGERLTYLAGLFYYRNDWSLDRTFDASDIFGIEDGYLGIKTRAWSLFGSTRYELTDRLAVSAGLRYTDEDKTPTYERVSTGPPLSDPITRTTLQTAGSDDLDGDLGLEFRPTKTAMLYARWARGSKSGGFQSRPDTLAGARYDGEVAYTSEVGGKLDLGRRGYATIALFKTRVDGFQVGRLATINGINQSVISNSNVQTVGAEASGSWSVFDDLTITGNVLYSEAKFTEDLFSDDGAGGQILEAYDGMVLPRAPRWTAQLGAKYETDLGDDFRFRAQGTLRYASTADLQLRASNPLAPKSEEHTTLDLQVAIANKSGGWEVSVIGNNITNERYATFASDSFLDGSAYYGGRNRPASVAVQLKLVR